MSKYRKKPVIVDAEQFFVDKKPWPDGVIDLKNEVIESGYGLVVLDGKKNGIRPIKDGDWVTWGGDRVKIVLPDIFEQTYEVVE